MGKIASISYAGHSIFNESQIDITNEKTFSSENYITLLIGENGSGKSELLKSIVQFYRRDHVDSNIWSKMNITQTGITKRTSWPQKIIAYSLSINDKFPYQKNKWDGKESYFYAGLKTTSNTIYIGKYREDLFKCFYLTSMNESKEELLLNCLEFMGLPTRFQFKLTLGSNFYRHLSRQGENSNVTSIVQSFIDGRPPRKDKDLDASRLVDNHQALTLIADFVSSFYIGEHHQLDLNINVIKKNDNNKNNTELMKLLILLIDNKILSISEFNEISQSDFINLSSGQFNLIRNIATLASQLVDDALVIIDEPEISLHPSWQIKYMDLIKSVLSKFKGCHAIVASHSHLLATSLPTKNANVIISKNVDGISINPFEASPTGWSSDMILYGVFGVLTRGNAAFENDLRTVSSLLNDINITNLKKIQEALSRLDRYALPSNDPLTTFLKKAKEKIKDFK
ncbi:ATP-binding protein [Pantoea dispersa]|uniref:ATP-binding protein n=1 Tax=Pantoea dispersa TaxID=59814 RepID=UPI0021F78835|nr:ATP-binding protein [Pantoea dispersa]MCW0322561.1 hypothetical protein [Pantoea dispersa]MCW0327485.1 hypothetical protein [Pantoea dispersa]MCW0433910.1 hypothetical protein [Pantoea dispersa]